MADWRGKARALPVWLAVPVVGLAWTAYALRESAMAVLGDPTEPGLVLAGTGLVLGVLGLLLQRGQRRRRALVGTGVVVVIAAAVAFGALSWFRSTYRAEDVRFSHDGVALAGTLYTPRVAGPHPAAVLVHGSGRASRREPSFHARFLARRGIAALAYDKRGVGESTGDLYQSDYGDYAADALAGVRFLASRPEVDPGAIGLVGFSEAEWVAPLAAARSDTVAYVAVIGAAGLSPAEQVSTEMAMRLKASGYGEPVVERALDLNEQLFHYQRTGEGAEALAAALAEARGEPWFEDAEDLPTEVYSVQDYAWWRSVMDFDPAPVWEKVRVPVLLLKGGRDDRSSPEPMRTRIAAALARGGNDDLHVEIYPEADHMLLEWPLGDRRPPPVFTPGYPDVLVPWILDRTSSR